jgi:DNA mismatch endonuclease (patch repair protein)
MPDRLSPTARAALMARIGSSNTAPEAVVAQILRGLGVHFRRHVAALAGTPDFVVSSVSTVIFVHGCYWHRHRGCRRAYMPSRNIDFWQAKFTANVARDKRVAAALRRAGWSVLTVWECQVQPRRLVAASKRIERHLIVRRRGVRP